MSNKHKTYNPERDCELDAAFHIFWRESRGNRYALSNLRQDHPDDGVIGWAQAHYPEQHAKLAAAFKASVREVLG